MKSKSKPSTLLLATILTGAITPSPLLAVDFFFNVPSGDWNAPGSWSPAGPPAGGGGNFAFVNNGGTAAITADIPAIQDPFIGRGGGNSGTVNHSAGVANFSAGWSFIGTDGGTGTYNLTGPGNTLGSGSISTGRIYVGGVRDLNGGNGTMRINTSGTVTATSDLSVGTRGATGVLNVTAGTVTANSWMIIGETHNGAGGSTGTVTQDGGAVNVSAAELNGRFWIGSLEGGAGPASSGSYTINGGTLTTRTAIIGKNYTGTLNQNGGVVTMNQGTDGANGDHRLGEAAGSTGNYNLTGGTLNTNANFQIGASGTGNFTQNGGTVNAANFPVVGRLVGGTGSLSISAGVFNQTNGGNALIIGEEGTGTLALSGGSVNVAGNLLLGPTVTGNGTVNQAGGSVNVTGGLDMQGLGLGAYNLTGGTLSVDGTIDAIVGIFGFNGGRITRSNSGLIDFNGNLVVGNPAAGFKLDTDKTFDVSGVFDITAGVTFEVTGLTIPAYDGSGIDTGSFPLGVDGVIGGTFSPPTTSLPGLVNLPGATFISEAAGEGTLYNPNTDSVYWVQESAGVVTVQYSVVPEPGSAGLLAIAGIGLLARRRRK